MSEVPEGHVPVTCTPCEHRDHDACECGPCTCLHVLPEEIGELEPPDIVERWRRDRKRYHQADLTWEQAEEEMHRWYRYGRAVHQHALVMRQRDRQQEKEERSA